MTITELSELGSEMMDRHPDQKDLIFFAVNDAFMDLEDDDPLVQKLADWIMSICRDNVRIDPAEASLVISE